MFNFFYTQKLMRTKLLSIFALLLMVATGAVAQTETLRTTITATAQDQASNSTANVAPVKALTGGGEEDNGNGGSSDEGGPGGGGNPGSSDEGGAGGGSTNEPSYSVTLADGIDDAANWTISPAAAGAGETVTLTYAGTKTVKSIKVVKKEAAATARPLTEATAEDLGKIVGGDGNIYDTKDAAEAAGTTAVAMIAYVGSDTDHATYKHGLAIALADESDLDWSTAKSTCEGKSAVTNAAWLLPSQNQWKTMFKAFGDDDASYTGLNTAITTAGGTDLKGAYWSSTPDEDDEDRAMYVSLVTGNNWWNSSKKYFSEHVRACLAF